MSQHLYKSWLRETEEGGGIFGKYTLCVHEAGDMSLASYYAAVAGSVRWPRQRVGGVRGTGVHSVYSTDKRYM